MIKPPMLVVAVGIAITVIASAVSIEHPLTTGPTSPKGTPPSVDDDPDPMVRAEKLCKAMRDTPEYRTGTIEYRDATDGMCEEQKRYAADLLAAKNAAAKPASDTSVHP